MNVDYDNCLTNLSNSILKYFDCDTFHSTLPELDKILKEDSAKNVVLILCDGMGSEIIDRNLHENDFLRKNRICNITSVFPPTTTSATTSLLSGLNPNEHGWLGWDMYIKPEDKIITMFTGCLKDTDTPADKESLTNKYYSYKSIIEIINKKHRAEQFYSFVLKPFYAFQSMLDSASKMCKEDGKKFIYVYYTEPDSLSHEFGSDSEQVISMYRSINDRLESFCNRVEDTTVIITADHGHITCEPIRLDEYKDIFDTLDGDISIEGRACNFRIKKDRKEEFITLFNKYFSDYFILLTKDEVIEKHIFGYGKDHRLFNDSLGDFLAIATSNRYFRYNDNSILLKSMHAGSLDVETKIPLILSRKK